MHVLVIGGEGFIGSHSVEQLIEVNIPVRVLDNFPPGLGKICASFPARDSKG